jgi:hypothetical protein
MMGWNNWTLWLSLDCPQHVRCYRPVSASPAFAGAGYTLVDIAASATRASGDGGAVAGEGLARGGVIVGFQGREGMPDGEAVGVEMVLDLIIGEQTLARHISVQG